MFVHVLIQSCLTLNRLQFLSKLQTPCKVNKLVMKNNFVKKFMTFKQDCFTQDFDPLQEQYFHSSIFMVLFSLPPLHYYSLDNFLVSFV